MEKWKEVRPWVRNENFLSCLPAHIMDFAKDVHFLSTRFQVGSN